jgi:glycosyltransferase involved in cell wall biosynthesis
MQKLSSGSEWALLLAPESPYPMTSGGAVRTASICLFLSARFRLHLVGFKVGNGMEAAPALPAGAAERVDWISLPNHSRRMPARLARNVSRLSRSVLPLTDRFSGAESMGRVARTLAGRSYRIAVLEHFWSAHYEELVRQHAGLIVMDMHNVESAFYARCAETEAWPERWAHRRFAALAAREENRWLPRFDLVLAASEADRQRILGLAPGARVAVYPNAVPARFPEECAEEHCIAFSGNLAYHPNTAAVRYFAREIWPVLRRRDPALRWRLIGSNPQAVRRWIAGNPSIEATGPVEDALAELARIRLAVVPLRAGSGTRVKILEAWAAGRAVVSTRIGAEGLPAVHGENLLLADSPADMVEQICALLANEELRRRLGRAGRRAVEQSFCWPVAWRALEENLAQLVEDRTTVAGRTGSSW